MPGDPVRAIRLYRAALASWAQVGVKRRTTEDEREVRRFGEYVDRPSTSTNRTV